MAKSEAFYKLKSKLINLGNLLEAIIEERGEPETGDHQYDHETWELIYLETSVDDWRERIEEDFETI